MYHKKWMSRAGVMMSPERKVEPMRVENRSVMRLSERYEGGRLRRRWHIRDAPDAAKLSLLLDTHGLLEFGLFVYQILLAAPVVRGFLILVVRAGNR